jgi:hypothetical protein
MLFLLHSHLLCNSPSPHHEVPAHFQMQLKDHHLQGGSIGLAIGGDKFRAGRCDSSERELT